MQRLGRRLQEFLDWQHSHPRGLAGWLVGERMRQQHALETDWTLAQLEIAPGDEVLELDFGAGHAIAQAASLAQSGLGLALTSRPRWCKSPTGETRASSSQVAHGPDSREYMSVAVMARK